MSAGLNYTGRFAPSPTGPLHLGSLVGALASFLDARANGGIWLVRMEDLDPPREVAGAAAAILQSLRDHGLQWDGEVLWQSQRHADYQQVLDALCLQHKAFYCTCSRAELAEFDGVYPGTCRGRYMPPDSEYAIRLQVAETVINLKDLIQGEVSQHLQRDCGDFVLKRKDGLFAYQLAVVVDDAAQGVTHVVRGSDLLDSTPRQIWLQRQLGFEQPVYAHVPVVVDGTGQKLSKQAFAEPLQSEQAPTNLRRALRCLGQPVPASEYSVDDLIAWAVAHWQLAAVPRCTQVDYPG